MNAGLRSSERHQVVDGQLSQQIYDGAQTLREVPKPMTALQIQGDWLSAHNATAEVARGAA